MGDRTNPIKFGPEWLRNLPGAGAGAGAGGGASGGGASGGGASGGGTGAVAGGSGTRPTPHGTTPSKVTLAKLRYGREEMLALYDRDAVEPPEQLKVIEALYQARGKPPYALNTFEDDTNTGRMGGTGIGVAGGGLGGTVTGLGTVGGLSRGRGTIGGDVRGARPMGGDRTRARPMYRQTSVVRAAPWHQRGYEEEPRLWSNGGAGGSGGPGGIGSRTNGADPPDWPPKPAPYRSKRTANTNWRQQAGGREDMPPTDEWRSPENAGSRRQDKWPSMPGGDREWTHSSRRTWAAADSAEDALPEWALGENSEACAGTFDSSGAFHGYSNDDSDLPKSQESPYPLTRSHTHGAFSRSRTVDEGSDEWWASEKAKKLSPKRFMMEAGEGKGPGASAGASANTGAGGEAWGASAVDRESPPEARAQPEPRADRGDFKSVMLPSNNALRQKHQSIGSPTDTPSRRSVPPPLATPVPHPIVVEPLPLAAPPPALARPPLMMHHHQLHSEEEKETNKLVEDILDMNLDEQLRPAVRAGVGGATNDVLAAMFGSRYGPGPGNAVAEAELADRWYYEDPKRTIQGPFSSKEMYGWYKAGFFGPTLMVRRACDPAMRPLATFGHMPFGNFEPFPTYDLRREPLMPTTPHLPLDVESLWSGGAVTGPGELMWMQRPGLAAPMPGPLPTPLPPPLPTPMSAPLPVPLPAPPSSSDARLSQLPLYFWEHQPVMPSNVRLPEEIAKEMKTEEQILAQLRAAQSKLPGPPMTAMSSDCMAPPMPPVPAPLPAPPTSTILNLPLSPLPLPLPLPLSLADIPPPPPPTLAEQKARLPNNKPAKQPATKDVDKPTKTKENTNAKTKSKKPKDEKKDESEPKEEDRDSNEDRDLLANHEISPRNDEKLNKKDIEKEKKEWIKDGFTVVKGGDRGKRRADETRPLAAMSIADELELRDRKRIEEEKAAKMEDDKRKREKKQQQATSGGSVGGGGGVSTGAIRRLAWSAAASGGPPAAVPTLADIQRLERENRHAARELAPPAPTPPQPAAPAQPAPAPWAATGDIASNAGPSHHRHYDETHDGGFWEGPSGRNMGGAGRDDGVEFESWCIATLAGWRDLELDGPTFVTFLKDVESPFEVKEYVKCYLGESREASEFARAFLERRRRGGGGYGGAGGSGVRPPPAPADDLCAPAAAVTPMLDARAGAARNQRKHKKNRMVKLDARILGFSVTAAEDRINVGDIDTA